MMMAGWQLVLALIFWGFLLVCGSEAIPPIAVDSSLEMLVYNLHHVGPSNKTISTVFVAAVLHIIFDQVLTYKCH
jgi:hypothetical protein